MWYQIINENQVRFDPKKNYAAVGLIDNQWYFVIKIVLTYVRKKCSSVWGKTGEDREFVKFFRSLDQFIQIVKGQNNIW